MTDAPKHIRALMRDGSLEIEWPDVSGYRIPFRLLRGRCPCAACVNEFTGERVVDLQTIAGDVHPRDIGMVGNYALKITWSDGHDSGLFTWEHLRDICRSADATATGDRDV